MIKAVIFDLDGTLLDTLEGLMDSVNYALKRLGYPTRTIGEIRTFVGNGVAKLIERAIPKGTENPNFEKCLEIFKEHYSRTMQEKTQPYFGIIELLRELKTKGIKIGVVSNKYDLAVKELCNQYFPELIDLAVGESPTCRPKPMTDGINKILAEFNLTKDEILYIGDSEVDIQTAKNAQIEFLTVSWGFRETDYLLNNGAKEIVDTALEIINFV